MVALLKLKSKVIKPREPRKTFPVKNLFKRPKEMSELSQSQQDKVSQIMDTSTKQTGRKTIVPYVVGHTESDGDTIIN